MSTTIHAYLSEIAASRPDDVAIIDGENSLTFMELDQRSNQLAHTLIRLGVEICADQPVGVSLTGANSVLTILAVMKTGNPYLPLDPDYPAQHITVT